MMEVPTAKGTVTPLSSMFPVEDARKSAKRVQDALVEKQQELDRVKEFIADNTNLINLVQKLPDQLHHDIMVPFGKAAFFPGRLIHTNEFMVLLGEGYYAERTSKQTVEILKRRGKVLDSQVDSFKAVMKDLQAEALFFDTTASEAAEGLVEIREEYVKENLSKMPSESGLQKQDSPRISEADSLKDEDEDEDEDGEFARIMSRLDELEEEELAAEIENGSVENKKNNLAESDKVNNEDEEYACTMSKSDEHEEEELAEEIGNGSDENKHNDAAESDNEINEDRHADTVFDQFSEQISLDHNLRHPEDNELSNSPQQTKKKVTFEDLADQSCTGLTVHSIPEDAKLHGKSLATNVKSNSAEKALLLPEKADVAITPSSSSRKEISAQSSKPGFDRDKAFTGSIIEHAYNMPTNPQEQIGTASKPSGSQPSKPVSRFKMQRK